MAHEAKILELDVPMADPLVKRRKRGHVSRVLLKTSGRDGVPDVRPKSSGRLWFLVPSVESDPDAAAKVLEAAMNLTRKLGPAEVMKRLAASGRARQAVSTLPRPVATPSAPRAANAGNEAAERWLAMRNAFFEEYLSVTAPELARVTGSNAKNQSARAHDWVKAGRIFSVNDGAAERYPMFQIVEGQPVPRLVEILKTLSEKLSAWQIAFWFTSPNAWTGSWRVPADILASEPETVHEAARHEVASQVF